MASFQIEILICTIDDGIERVSGVLMPPIANVRYIVSMQYTDVKFLQMIPASLLERPDVLLSTIPGKGLSKNRNNALDLAKADILLISDDDTRYSEDYIKTVAKAFDHLSDSDILCFESVSYDGMLLKRYPSDEMPFNCALECGYCPSSVEIALRGKVRTRFDERFGLGSERLCAGEDDVFLKDASTQGYNISFVPEVIVSTDPDTTGLHFLDNSTLQITKGAVFKHIFGKRNAIWRSVRETAYHCIKSGANPFAIFVNMMKGIWMFR